MQINREAMRWYFKEIEKDWLGRTFVILAGIVTLLCLCCPAHAQNITPGNGSSPNITAQGIVFPLQDPPQIVNSASVTSTGQPGLRTFDYWIVVNALFGQSPASGPFVLYNAANHYGSGNGAQITWRGVDGAFTYDVLRTPHGVMPAGNCNCAVAVGLTSTFATDSSESLLSYTVNTANAGISVILLQNKATGVQTSCLAIDGVCIATGASGPTVETNGTPNISQTVLNFVDTASVTWSNPSGGVEEATAAGGGAAHAPQYALQYNDPLASFNGNAGFTYNPAPGVGFADVNLTASDPSLEDSPLFVQSNGDLVQFQSFNTDANNLFDTGTMHGLVTETDTVGSGIYFTGDRQQAQITEDSTNAAGDTVVGGEYDSTNDASGGIAAAVIGLLVNAGDNSLAGITGDVVGEAIGATTAGAEVTDVFNLLLQTPSIDPTPGGIAAELYGQDPTLGGDASAYFIYGDGGTSYFGGPIIAAAGCTGCGGGIGGTIANQELAGGTGADTIGPITDGVATWQTGQDTGADLDCYGSPNCGIELTDGAGAILNVFPGSFALLDASGNSATYSAANASISMGGATGVLNPGNLLLTPVPFAALPSPASAGGDTWTVNDSTTNVIGDTITGGGANLVQAFSNGVNWVVAAGGVSPGGAIAWGGITGTLSDQSDLQAALNLKANLASPPLSGVPTTPTAAPGTNTTQIASTAYVQAALVGAGLGTVTFVGSGDFTPLFTVAVSNPSSTPVFTFTAVNSTANTIFGNLTGSSAAASFFTVPTCAGAGSALVHAAGANLTCNSAITAAAMPYSGLTGIVPTWNQNTTGTAAGWTTPRLLAGNSVNGTANVPFANHFVVTGTADSGLTGAQFLGALPTGIVKVTTTTGTLSDAASSDVRALWTGTCNSGTYLRGDGACAAPGTLSFTASGTIALPTSSIAAGACAVATAVATGALTTDTANASPNADITGVTGYNPAANTVTIYPPYFTANQLNVKVCNPAANVSAIAPGAVTLNWTDLRP